MIAANTPACATRWCARANIEGNPVQTTLRSILFVPGDSEKKIAKVAGGDADALIPPPKTPSPQDVVRLDHYLTALEQREQVALGSTRIITVSTETPSAVLTMQGCVGCSPRLAGLTWGAEDLSAALCASTNLDESGGFAFTYRMARSLCLVTAHAADVQAIDTVSTDFRDAEALRSRLPQTTRPAQSGGVNIPLFGRPLP